MSTATALDPATTYPPLVAPPISDLTRTELAARSPEWLITTLQHLARENEVLLAENRSLRALRRTPARARIGGFITRHGSR